MRRALLQGFAKAALLGDEADLAHHGMASDIAQKGDIRPGLCDICKGRVVCVGYNEIPDDY